MQVKKFEAPTIQEALDTIKRELGPEAIILQTKKSSRGFGLMSKQSVEVTAAVSDRSLQKKTGVESKLPQDKKSKLMSFSAKDQAETYDRHANRRLEKQVKDTVDSVEFKSRPISKARYVDINEDGSINKQTETPKPAQVVPSQADSLIRATQQQAPSPATAARAQLERMFPIEEEMRQLKRMLEEMKTTQDEYANHPTAAMGTGGLSSPALQDSFEQLLLNGVDKRFAIPLLKKVAFEMGEGNLNDTDAVLDHVAAEMMTSTEVFSLLDGVLPRNLTAGADSTSHSAGPVLISLVGPTGVGKTTTVAKMASEALLKRNLKVGLINLDSYKVAAFDQLATYAKILNVPFRSAGSADDLAAAVQDFKNLDVVFIDTTGRSQRDPESLREMQAVLSRVSPQSHLVVSATTRDLELYDIANRFSVFKPQGLVVSKLDEATTYGALYNVSQRSKLPLAYFTTGQRVPEDIEEATRERMVALIMNI